ncbi:MAG: molecular chaperone HtpG [Alphaproteobacteria bacterium]
MTQKNEEKLKFGAEVSKILQLVIHSLYANKDIFIRELISNASDACDKLRYEAVTKPELAGDDTQYAIDLLVDKAAGTLTIRDNGIGMSRDELVNNLGTIAKSGTQEFLAALSKDNKKDALLIGQFGVGFYSAFMVADKVSVISTRAGTSESWKWESAGQGEFTISSTEAAPRGTSITIHLKKGEEEYLDSFRLRHIVQTYSDHISFPIALTDAEGHKETINTGAALWMRSKNDIKPEQYTEFYRHVAHAPDEPWLTLHNKAEGKVEYNSLLFVPSAKPFDLFHPERKRRVKLYVKRVFITEENADLVPAYMRFIRGVVDSEDLPLNISRETLQHNPMMTKIRESIVKRVLSELKKKGEEDEVSYLGFWNNFGAVLKEGLCEGHSPREQILEVCRFNNNISDERTSLDAYVSRMKEGQDTIFYLTGDNVDVMRQSPQIEGFTKRGIEVLLLSDHVDDFWVNVVQDYKGKKFKSVTRADIDLDTIAKESAPEEKPKVDSDAVKSLCEKIKTILGDKVKDVRATHKLTQSAVCLAVDEGGMDFRFERFLVEQKQLQGTSAKVLEINPEHSIIKSLVEKRADEKYAAELEDVAWLLFDQARIVEGETISDPASFTRRLQNFVQKSLAA